MNAYQIMAQVETNYGLTVGAIGATLLYTTLGILILAVAVTLLNKLFGFNIRHELIEDNNIAVGVAIAGLALSIAIIIAGTIGS